MIYLYEACCCLYRKNKNFLIKSYYQSLLFYYEKKQQTKFSDQSFLTVSRLCIFMQKSDLVIA